MKPIFFLCALAFTAHACATPGTGPKTATTKPGEVATPSPPPSALQKVLIEVNIPATEMVVYENCRERFRKPIAIGAGIYPTPEQNSEITKIEWNPWWYPPPNAEWAKDKKLTPPGPGNPLGRVKMPLSKEILFHGTTSPGSVGRPVSHGCMRMLNNDAVELAWYLQSLFSEKNDPKFLEGYEKNRKRTSVIQLNSPVPVRIIYNPVVAEAGILHLYPDYYHKLGKGKKAAIINELMKQGIDTAIMDDGKIGELAKHWPGKKSEVAIEELLTVPLPKKIDWKRDCV